MSSTRAMVLTLAALLSACGGGGSTTSLSVSPPSLSFRMEVGGAAPAPVLVNVTYRGDGLVAGYPTGVSPATWITHTDLTATSPTTAQISIGVTPSSTPGRLTTTIRFATGRADGSDVKYVDVPVTYVVATPFAVTGPALAFSAVTGQAGSADPAAGLQLAVEGSSARWSVSRSAPWLTVAPALGAGPGTLTVTASGAGLAQGTYQGTVTIADADSGRQVVLDASLGVHAPQPVVVPPAGWSIDLAAGAAALTRAVQVSDQAGGGDAGKAVSWTLTGIDADWLQWSPASGTTVPPAAVTLTVDPAKLAATGRGAHVARVTLAFTNADGAGQSYQVAVPVSGCLPRATLAAPRVLSPGVAAEVVLRGEGFSCPGVAAATRLAATGDTAPTTVDADTQLRVSLPALGAGSSPLHFDGGAGLVVPGPDLAVAAVPAMTYQAVAAPGARTRLLWDAGRTALYGVSAAGGAIERYAFTAGAWAAQPAVTAGGLRDAALALDGGSLLVATTGALGDVDLSAADPAFTPRVANPDTFCGGYFGQLAPMNDGKAVVAFRLAACSGFHQGYLYDPVSHALTASVMLYQGTVAAPADGSRAYLASNGLSPAPTISVRGALDGMVVGTIAAANVGAIALSRDASRVLLNDTDVRDRALTQLGRLPAVNGATLAMAGDRAFAYREDTTATASGPRLEIYDLTVSLALPTDTYPLSTSISLADSPSAGASGAVQLTVTHDDAVVFVSGDARILVVPLL